MVAIAQGQPTSTHRAGWKPLSLKMLGKAREAALLHEAQNGIGDIFECFDRQFGINWQGERLGSGGGRVRAISRASLRCAKHSC